MKIEITDELELPIFKVAKAHKVTPHIVVESAVMFTLAVTLLSTKKQATIHQWVEEEKLKRS